MARNSADYWKAYYAANKSRIVAQRRAYLIAHLEETRRCAREKYWKNRDQLLARNPERKNEIREYNRQYYLRNKATLQARHQAYSRQYHLSHPRPKSVRVRQPARHFRIKNNLRSRLSHAIRDQAGIKAKRTVELTGCDMKFLLGYLEAQFTSEMKWSNYGSVWEIDHIIPCRMFDLSDESHQRSCFHYTNLRPLLKSENRRKSGRLICELKQDLTQVRATATN